jgi:hypothetical protein
MGTPAGVGFARRRGGRDAGLSRRSGVGSRVVQRGRRLFLGLGAPLGGVPCLLLACWLARQCSLFDPRRRRGRILRDVPRPDALSAHHGAQRQSLVVFDRSLMGAKRSGAPRAAGLRERGP